MASGFFESGHEQKRQKSDRKGFRVGPDNLPDGTYRRKVVKIKRNLIKKAQLRKDLIRARAQVENAPPTTAVYDAQLQEQEANAIPSTASMNPHPDRQAFMNDGDDDDEPLVPTQHQSSPPAHDRAERSQLPLARPDRQHPREPRRPKTQRFSKEVEEAEQRRRQREDADALHAQKIKDRQRMQKAVAHARKPGKDGKRRLGREGLVLLEKIKKMTT